jgi:hypothetical protein
VLVCIWHICKFKQLFHTSTLSQTIQSQVGLSSLTFVPVFELKGRLDAGNRHQTQASLLPLEPFIIAVAVGLISKVMKDGIACRRVRIVSEY